MAHGKHFVCVNCYSVILLHYLLLCCWNSENVLFLPRERGSKAFNNLRVVVGLSVIQPWPLWVSVSTHANEIMFPIPSLSVYSIGSSEAQIRSIPLQKKTGCPSCWSALGRQPPTGRPFTDYARCRELSCPPLLGQLRTTLKDHCRGPVGFLWGLLGLLLNLQHRSTSPPAPFSFLLPSQSFALKATS